MTLNFFKKAVFVFSLLGTVFMSCDDTPVVPNLPFSSLQEFFDTQAPTAQTFTVDPTTTQTITGSKGTSITFFANSFVDMSGNAVTDPVTVKLTEVFSKGDMILVDRMTTSNGQLLESGGEFLLEATANGQAVELNQMYNMQVPISSATSNPNAMDLFVGQTVQDTFTWVPVDSSMIWTDSSNYNIYFDSLTWINCDYFYGSGLPTTNVNVEPVLDDGLTLTNVRAYLVFNNINSVTSLYYNNATNTYRVNAMPIGESVEIVMVGMNATQIYLGTLSTTLTNSNTIQVPLAPVTQAQLTATINGL